LELTPLTSSELILNKDGSVFHLGILPENIADIILTVGDPQRAELIATYFDIVDFRKTKREFTTITGRISSKRLSVISTGIGTDNIDIVLSELVFAKRYNLKNRIPENKNKLTVIRLGTTGSINNEHQLNDIVYSKYAIAMDGLLQFYEHQLPEINFQNLSFPVTAPNPRLEEHFKNFKPSLTLTASGFYGPQFRNAVVRPKYVYEQIKDLNYGGLKLGNIEMETAGIYGLSKLYAIDAISLSVVLANREAGSFSKSPDAAIVHLIESALDRICLL
jgi:uridine phosphorylase